MVEGRISKREVVEEINEILDDLSSVEVRMFLVLNLQQLVRFKQALQKLNIQKPGIDSDM